jgi:hypothetical protein
MISTDPISYARDRIMKRGIDKTILELMYGGLTITGTKKNISLEIDKEIATMCKEDFDLVSGEIIDIPLSRCKCIDMEGKVYVIPPEARRNRDVRDVLSLRTSMGMPQHGSILYGGSGSPVIDSLANLSNSIGNPYTDGVAQVKLVDSNTFRVTTNTSILATHNTVAVEIENRDRLANIKKGSYPKFFEIAKAYIESCIYNDRLRLRKTAIFGGHEISDIEGEIDSFSDSGDKYQEFIDDGTIGKMLIYADEVKLHNFYSQQIKNI